MKEIFLSDGSKARVSDEDYEYINEYVWTKHVDGYGVRGFIVDKKKYTTSIHKQIANRLGFPISSKIDHKDGDPSNSQRENLRKATEAQNSANRRISSGNISGYKGVSFDHKRSMWRVRICLNKRTRTIGWFSSPEEAAIAYNEAAKKYFGEFARLNEI